MAGSGDSPQSAKTALRHKLDVIIFGTDTPAGRLFDLLLIYTILVSVVAVMLDSIAPVNAQFGYWLFYLEWFFTLLFTAEYLLRIWISPKPWRYATSFYGLVDLLSVIPTYLAIFIVGANYLLIIRLLRVLRVFRILKLVRYSDEAGFLLRAMYSARRKIAVFFLGVLVVSTVFGCLMFVVEGPGNGFTSIPKSIYWTIVTITTVGYGDITPITVFGQFISTLAMLTGYSIIAIPTGILSVEMMNEANREKDAARALEAARSPLTCKACSATEHGENARFCQFCGGSVVRRSPVNE